MTEQQLHIACAENREEVQRRFDESYMPEPNTGCWLWTGIYTGRGYAQFKIARKGYQASHVSLWLAGRPLPKGRYACHHCDTPGCVNPDHLFAGTQRDNIRDCVLKGRHGHGVVAGATHPRSKFTEAQVRYIRRCLASGERSGADLAREFGVAQSTISAIKRGRNWSATR